MILALKISCVYLKIRFAEICLPVHFPNGGWGWARPRLGTGSLLVSHKGTGTQTLRHCITGFLEGVGKDLDQKRSSLDASIARSGFIGCVTRSALFPL